VPSYKYFLTTGLTLLDVALRTTAGNGLVGGKVATFTGPPQSGKTALAMKLISIAQAAGGGGAWFDAENRFSPDLADLMRVDVNHNFFYGPPDTLEVCLSGMERAVNYRLQTVENNKKCKENAPFVVVLDSVAQMGNKKIANNSLEEGKQNPMAVASFWSDFFRRPFIRRLRDSNIYIILINQLRKAMATPGSWAPPPAAMPGGEVHGFAQTIHLRFTTSSLSRPDRNGERPMAPLGTLINIKVMKHDGVPMRQVQVPYYYHFGWDDGLCCLNYLINHKYLKRVGAYIKIDSEQKFKGQWRRKFYKDAAFAESIRQMARDAYSDENYYTENEDLDDVEVAEDEDEGQGAGE